MRENASFVLPANLSKHFTVDSVGTGLTGQHPSGSVTAALKTFSFGEL